jgi:N-acetylglucosamine malate deacetylase 2
MTAAPPRILLVTAHPDDEAFFAVTLYRLVHELAAELDVIVMTRGEGGFRHAALAERLYGERLTDPEVARASLPAIRARELAEALRILGAREHVILGEPDTGFSLDPRAFVEEGAWARERAVEAIRLRLSRGYDLLFVMLPTKETHAHHKASAVLALSAVMRADVHLRPAVLGGLPLPRGEAPARYAGLEGWEVTRPRHEEPSFLVDRRLAVAPGSSVTFAVVADWVIAAHKSQGVMQTRMGAYDAELYWSFACNTDAHEARVRALLEPLCSRS